MLIISIEKHNVLTSKAFGEEVDKNKIVSFSHIYNEINRYMYKKILFRLKSVQILTSRRGESIKWIFSHLLISVSLLYVSYISKKTLFRWYIYASVLMVICWENWTDKLIL